MAATDSTVPRSPFPEGARFLKPGDPVPKGSIAVPFLRAGINCDGGTPFTLAHHVFFRGEAIVGLVNCRNGRSGKLADFRLKNGETRGMYLSVEDLNSPHLADLTKSERNRLAKYLANAEVSHG